MWTSPIAYTSNEISKSRGIVNKLSRDIHLSQYVNVLSHLYLSYLFYNYL